MIPMNNHNAALWSLKYELIILKNYKTIHLRCFYFSEILCIRNPHIIKDQLIYFIKFIDEVVINHVPNAVY
jgi:hypothetical protein